MEHNSKLIWPDVHHRTGLLEAFLERNGDQYGERYFLGDFQDQFHDTPEHAERTAKYVKKLLEDPRNFIGLGNHDLPYMFPWNKHVWCPGFEIEKSKAINSVLTADDWAKMKLAFYVDGWLISHAGIHASFFGERSASWSLKPEDVLASCHKALERSVAGWDRLVMPGSDRGFSGQQLGGITWLDWSKFQPINGLNQIVGHTPGIWPYVKYMDNDGICYHRKAEKWGVVEDKSTMKSVNWNIDTNNDHFGVLEDGEFSVYPTKDFL